MVQFVLNLQRMLWYAWGCTVLASAVVGRNVPDSSPTLPHVRWQDSWELFKARDPPCTAQNKQKALYISYEVEPPLETSPATSLVVETTWLSVSAMRRYGSNGVFAAHPFHTGGPGGYFGSQADGDPSQGGLLFSIWDSEAKKENEPSPGCSGSGPSPNETWCNHLHSFPLSDTCHRHCLDCGLHPGWYDVAIPLLICDNLL